MAYKSKLKSELAQAAGVSLPTFRRWLLFTRMQFVAVTGKAKSGKTYLNSILMAAAGLEPASNAGLTDKGHFLGLERIQYDMPNKIQFCVDKEGLPVGCAENSGLTSEAQDKEKQGGGFNGEYVGADGNTYYNVNRNFLTRIPEPVSTAYVPL